MRGKDTEVNGGKSQFGAKHENIKMPWGLWSSAHDRGLYGLGKVSVMVLLPSTPQFQSNEESEREMVCPKGATHLPTLQRCLPLIRLQGVHCWLSTRSIRILWISLEWQYMFLQILILKRKFFFLSVQSPKNIQKRSKLLNKWDWNRQSWCWVVPEEPFVE